MVDIAPFGYSAKIYNYTILLVLALYTIVDYVQLNVSLEHPAGQVVLGGLGDTSI